VQLRIASVLFRDGRFREAIAEYDVYERAYGSIALSVGVGLDQVRFTVAEAHRELAREAGAPEYELARAAYHAVVSDYPSSPRVPEALYGLGHSLYGLAELEAAAGEFATVVEAFPQAQVAAHAQSWRARLAYLAGDGEQAASLYRELISAYPNSELIDQTWKDLGLVYKGLDQTEAATEALSRVDPGFAAWPKVQAEAADMLLAAGQIDRIESQLDLDEALRRAAAAGDGESVAEIHYVLGRVGRARGDHAAEVEHFTQVQAHSGNEGLASFAGFFRGLAFYQLGSAADAAGDSAAGSGHFTAAVNDLESVLATDNSEMRSIAYRTRGIALTRLGRSSEAVGAYEALIAGAPSAQERAEFELMLMELYFDLGQLEQTKTAARQLIAADFVDESGGFSFKERAHFVLVSVLLEQELYDQAHTAATAALRRYPRSANRSTLILTSARSLFFSERYETSATAFQRFIDENPTHPELGSAYLQLGYCREILGEYEAAATAFQALARNLPSDPLVPDALYRAGENLYNLSRFEAALGLFVQVVEDHPRSNSAEMALYSASWTYMDLDRENDSLAAMRRLVDDYPGSGYARFAQFSIGDYLYSKKRFEEAQAAYEQVLQRFPGTSEADKAEGLLTDLEEDLASREYDEVFTDFQAGRYAAAASAFEAIFESYPDSYSALAALANKGVALEHLGNSTEARSTYERVLTAAGERPESSDIANFARLRLENL
jgi:TolA-binding protein